MPTRSDTARLRTAQTGLRTLVERDLAAFSATLDLGRPERARDALLTFTPQLVDTYGLIAATVAADWYDTVRAAEKVPGKFRATPVVPDESEAIVATVRRSAGALFTDTPATALDSLTGPVGKYALSGSRETIMRSSIRDPQASGWTRVTSGGSCAFCRMLAGRGAVYARDTADFASHTHCHCTAAPSWDPGAPEVPVEVYSASMRTSLMSDSARAAHTARTREYLKTLDT